MFYRHLNFLYWVDEYTFLFIYIVVVFLFISFLWFITINLSYNKNLFEKTSQYECGFEPYGWNSIFDLQYFLIGLLYLIFDVELSLIVPWLICFSAIPLLGLISMLVFMVLFLLGLIYEWKKNILHWT